ncbi:MAG TPA: ACP S-malonyltransferase [Galbitalea sp.]|nr:ACP S-malonyltransferase [Galbitalea sp.]
MIVVVAPGQGSQTPGFLDPWIVEPRFREHLQRISDSVAIDLVKHGTTSDEETIRDTAIAQPLIVAAGLLAFEGLVPDDGKLAVGGVAGHSVGEITASVLSGILSEEEAFRFVKQRSQGMADAAALVKTGMSAVIGGDEDALLTQLKDLDLEPANFNGGGQIVVAGELTKLAKLAEGPLPGTRVIPLKVAGAFHTRYMEPSVAALHEVAASIWASDPILPIWTNRDGSLVESGTTFVDLMVSQVTSPVRWDLTMAALSAAGVTGLIELAPAGALVGLARRGLKGVPTVAIKTPDDLSAAHDMMNGK